MKTRIAFLILGLFAFSVVKAQTQQAPAVPNQMQPVHQDQRSPMIDPMQGPPAVDPRSPFGQPSPVVEEQRNANTSYHIIDAPNGTFGYDVFVDGKLMIHQTSIPAMPGNDGFQTKDDASKVAEMVISKIRKGEMPMVTPEEMKVLGTIQSTN